MMMGNELAGTGIMDNIFQKVEKGKCRIALNGQIAVWTTNGYKTFSVKNNSLVNCSTMVTEFGDDFFYVVPAAKVKPGDIILVNGTPRCVMKAEKNLLTVMNYETGAVENIIPERHMFMGSVYFYRKIITPMPGMFGGGKNKAGKMLRMMMMTDMMKNNGTNDRNGGNGMNGINLMQLMLMPGLMKDMGGSMTDLFDGFADDEEEMEEEEDEVF